MTGVRCALQGANMTAKWWFEALLYIVDVTNLPPMARKSVSDDIFGLYQIPGAVVTITEKVFMTATIITRRSQFFSDDIPTPIRRPLLLVLFLLEQPACTTVPTPRMTLQRPNDNTLHFQAFFLSSTSHISLPIVDGAKRLVCILVWFPPNCPYILQPMGATVFSPFKTTLKIYSTNFCLPLEKELWTSGHE
ncbi:hypothetical protein PHPALM_191 [Phytophthora palmivora]|uniref:Uncharacterized protein n=1 Tax=Phytophthora palmivora TaxID=4796 RepID=A0A2P4YVF5_9STRA|nr:hypothetical protein PHPALM_191 [Phytophthora palmivora]